MVSGELSRRAGLTNDIVTMQRDKVDWHQPQQLPSVRCNYTKGNYERGRQELMAPAVELSCMSQFDCRRQRQLTG